MINNSTNNSKLDEVVKTTLTEYEAPFDGGDWNRMESMLNAAPKQGAFKWSGSLTAIVVSVAVLAGGYFIYTSYSSTKTNTTASPVIENKTAPAPATKIPVTIPTTPAVVTTPAITEEAATPLPPESTPVIKEKVKEEKLTTKEEKVKPKKEKAQNPAADEHNGPVRVVGMSEPIFGDMLDSSKGIIGETREKEETKKAAKASKNVPVGWNSILFPNLNTDSLKKHREKRDSVKVQ